MSVKMQRDWLHIYSGSERERTRKAYRSQKSDAAFRGISFLFTYPEWCLWWERCLGPDWEGKRGLGLGQYVMARNGDVGPYAPENVRAISQRENAAEKRENNRMPSGADHHATKLTPDQVREARSLFVPYKRGRSARFLAKKYGVCYATMTECLRGETWHRVH